MKLKHDVSLAAHTTLGVGGVVSHWAEVITADDVHEALALADDLALPVAVIGGGSNIVAEDDETRVLAIHPIGQRVEVCATLDDQVTVLAQAGLSWDELVRWAVERDLAGVTCLSGIPGCVGAAPMQNIGAYGQDLSEVFAQAEVYDLERRRVESWDAARCAFGYRDSALKRAAGRFVVLSVTLTLQRGGRPTLRYGELQRRAEEIFQGSPNLQELRELVLNIRRGKGMVLDPRDPASRSAGSFFMNPVVSVAVADAAESRLGGAGSMPRYPAGDGAVKLSAAWLIERSGMPKGYLDHEHGGGRVGLSPKHTLALINRGDASAADVLAFAAHVRARVLSASGVSLEREPVSLSARRRPV